VGDVTEYESTGALMEAVGRIKGKLEERREKKRAAEAKIHAAEAVLRDKNSQLAGGLEEALMSNKQLALELYAERRLANHPEANKIRAVLDHAALESREQVDEILEQFREVARDPDDLAGVRDRVRNALGGGRESLPESRVRGSRDGKANYNGLGSSLHELRSLSGLGDRG